MHPNHPTDAKKLCFLARAGIETMGNSVDRAHGSVLFVKYEKKTIAPGLADDSMASIQEDLDCLHLNCFIKV